jgi:hypothetical protein
VVTPSVAAPSAALQNPHVFWHLYSMVFLYFIWVQNRLVVAHDFGVRSLHSATGAPAGGAVVGAGGGLQTPHVFAHCFSNFA